jgi:predicted DsbA family dithiol-disulfide isomerase
MMDPGISNLRHNGDSQSLATLTVDVIADLVCPWCYLGKRRLTDALAAVHGPAAVSWHPFQLNPDMPVEGMAFDEYLASKFGRAETVEPGLERLTLAGRAEGIDFRFDRIARVPNTLDAHRVMKLAEDQGANTSELAERILKGFFEEGLNLSDRDVLVDLAGRDGLSTTDIRRTLDDDRTRDVVLTQEALVRKGGVTGVPDFLINKRLFVIGAQATDVLVKVFDRAMFGEDSDQPVSPTIN